MSKINYPTTSAIRFLRAHDIAFEPMLYAYEAHGGTHHSAQVLKVDEHMVIKTIVFKTDKNQALIVLMHGDREISTKELARFIGVKHIEPVSEKEVTQLTGYQVGGCSPFGTRKQIPVYIQSSIYDLPLMCINGGKRGMLVKIKHQELKKLNFFEVDVAIVT
ncbi:Cys-tRNA(Pro) deacylase [Neisseriaceae bacterium PsAf]|nr:Cys-tRNA(Pro) deacylase [Neisseriaceae bacterium PsAf]